MIDHIDSTAPVMDVDPFSEDFLANPYAYHERLRDAGPVLWIPKYNVFAMARYEQVNDTLRDWETFSSAAGGGLTNFNVEKPWRPPSIVLEADPPLHTQTRGVLNRILNRPVLEKLREGFENEAVTVVDRALEQGFLDGVKDLAEVFPLQVFPNTLGLQKEGRENLLPYANMAFNAFGPKNDIYETSFREASGAIEWVTAQCRREALSSNGLGAEIYSISAANGLTEDQAGMLVRSLLTAGLDTTIYGITHALFSFASFPDQWTLLQNDGSLLKGAFEEVVRYQSPVQTFFRTTTRPVEVCGVSIPENQKILLFLSSANRDPRKWESPDVFDITRRTTGHVGFGAGIHICVGQMLARLEAEVVLRELLKRVSRIELVGQPVKRLNNTLRGFASLPLRLHAG